MKISFCTSQFYIALIYVHHLNIAKSCIWQISLSFCLLQLLNIVLSTV
ncbi:hypothetical protein CoNPh26_CDS0040 [Staphylococcus phage S-CoN_Ph26]|nr:hypothetical protein CoNPh26_CDS0040 [Staphylococcus phage S-CoN_Ph26]